MNKIEEYIKFICKNTRGTKKEIEDLKQEMISHLTQTVQELIADGKNEQESVELAISRFGEKHQVQNELAQVYSVQKRFGQVLLLMALIFLVIGISSLITERVAYIHFWKVNNFALQEIEQIKKVADTNNLTLLDETVRGKFSIANNQLAYVSMVQLPDDTDMANTPPTIPLNQNIKYEYPKNIKNIEHFNAVGHYFVSENEKMYIQVGVKYPNEDPNGFYLIAGVCFILYWVLFGLWATINAYHKNRLGLAWSIIFFVLNVPGYLLHKIYYWFKVDRVA